MPDLELPDQANDLTFTMIRGNVLIDDGPHNLIGGEYRKILYDAPHNQGLDAEGNGMIRVRNWDEIETVIRKWSKE